MAGGINTRFNNQVLAGVLAVVEDQRRQVLFVREQPGGYGGTWLLPGGSMAPGETVDAAVIRAVADATGIKLAAPEFMGVYELRSAGAEGPCHALVLAFTAQTFQEIPADFRGSSAFQDPQKMSMSLQATDMQVLTDAGLAVLSRSTITRELDKAAIQLDRYGIRPQLPLTDAENVTRRLRG